MQSIMERIKTAAEASGRTAGDVRLAAVTKSVDTNRVIDAIHAGVTIIGENYIQEAQKKREQLTPFADGVSFHFIGHLQTNKAKFAVRLFDMIQSVDSLKLARAINEQAAKIDKIQHILIQINVGGEASKSGMSFQEAEDLMDQLEPLKHVALKGFMAIPPYFDDPENSRPFFSSLRKFKDRIQNRGNWPANADPGELSMGMTSDFETAIAEGATIVRIGTAIFGARD